MKRRILKSLPSTKNMLMIALICLIFGVLIAGLYPGALYGLGFAVGILLITIIGNYGPDGYQEYHSPQDYSRMRERSELYDSLEALTEAVEDEDASAVTVRAQKARETLDYYALYIR